MKLLRFGALGSGSARSKSPSREASAIPKASWFLLWMLFSPSAQGVHCFPLVLAGARRRRREPKPWCGIFQPAAVKLAAMSWGCWDRPCCAV